MAKTVCGHSVGGSLRPEGIPSGVPASEEIGVRNLTKSWQVNALRHTVKAAVPFKRSLRRLKRRIGRRAPNIDEHSVYSGGFDHIRALEKVGEKLHNKEILEIGSGWYPVIPLMMRAAGARLIHLTDVEPLLDEQTLLDAVAFLLDRRSDLADKLGVEPVLIENRLAVTKSQSLEEMLQRLGLTYGAPFDPGRSSLEVDVIVSHTVLEHIPPDILVGLFNWFRRCLRPGGLVSHGIDNSDHRANLDRNSQSDRLLAVQRRHLAAAQHRRLHESPPPPSLQGHARAPRHGDLLRARRGG